MLPSMRRLCSFHAGVLLAAAALVNSESARAEDAAPHPVPVAAPPATPANPQDVRGRCVSEHEQTQIERKREALLAARTSALSCSQAECPSLLRSDCVQWFAEIDREVPSLVISLRAGSDDVSAATARIDGKPASEALDGRLIELDPGKHTIDVTPPGKPTRTREVILAPGEKARLVVFELPSAADAAAQGAQKPAAVPTYRPVPRMTWILGGAAVVFAGVGAVFGGSALAERSKLQKAPDSGGCSPYCSNSQVAPVHHLTLAADISFGVAAASAVGSAITYFLRPEIPIPDSHPVTVGFGLSPNAAMIGLRGEL